MSQKTLKNFKKDLMIFSKTLFEFKINCISTQFKRNSFPSNRAKKFGIFKNCLSEKASGSKNLSHKKIISLELFY